MKKILFVCSQNKLRSPTGEAVFGNDPDLEVRSAGLNNNAEVPLGAEDVEWADVIFVMESVHKRKLQKQFKPCLTSQRVVCLNIPDDYQYMDPDLVQLLKQRVPQFI